MKNRITRRVLQSICLRPNCAAYVFTLIFVLATAIQLAAQTPTAGWPLFRGNPQSTGVADCNLPAELDVLWEFKVPRGSFESTAAIVVELGNATKKTVYIADLDGSVWALDLKTGEKRWELKTESGFVTTPAVYKGKLYLGDVNGRFYCVDESGKQVWTFQTEAEINASANFFGDNVIVGSQDANLYSLNADTGQLVWKFEADDQIRCSTTIADKEAFVAGCDGFFHVIDLETGKQLGSTEIGGPTGSTPAILGNLLFFGNEQGNFFAVDWKQIKNEWIVTPQNNGNSIRSSAAVTQQHVVFGARNRQIYSLDPKTGEQNWAVTLKAKIDSSPVIAGKHVYVASTDGRLYTLDLETGEKLWEKQFNGGFIGSPSVAFGHLVIATKRGVVYGLGQQ